MQTRVAQSYWDVELGHHKEHEDFEEHAVELQLRHERFRNASTDHKEH